MSEWMAAIRCILASPFALVAEVFARIALKISANELDVNFNYIGKQNGHDF